MSRFNCASKRVRDTELPEHVRFLAFLWCIESFGWLTRARFQDIYRHLGHRYHYGWKVKPTGVQMISALSYLTKARRGFLDRLDTFRTLRKTQKMDGKRQPTKAQVHQLYLDPLNF